MTNELPLILIFDLDGTIIGNVMPQIVMHDITEDFKKAGGKHTYKSKDFQNVLSNGLIRPYFLEFMKRIKEKKMNIECFVYTASEKQWANYVIRQIETSLQIKFNRPIFTRNECIVRDKDVSKSLYRIVPNIIRSLKKKHPLLTTRNIWSQMLVIDNSPVYPDDKEKKLLLLCPSYEYYYLENFPQYIPHIEYNKHQDILQKLTYKHYNIPAHKDFFDFQYQYYKMYGNEYAKYAQRNDKQLDDVFYKKLYKVFHYLFIQKGYTSFSNKVIDYIRKEVLE